MAVKYSRFDAPSSLSEAPTIIWGSISLQGSCEEMEDDIIVRSDCLDIGFAFAAVFDGHGGFSSVEFPRYLPDTIDVGGSSQPRSTGCEC